MAKAIIKSRGRSLGDEQNDSQDFPFPGTIGGGSLPSIAKETQQGAKALALVPQGLHPVAVFPPYQSTRTLPAISVIWLEDGVSPVRRRATMSQKKGMYGLWTKQWKQMNYRRHHLRKDKLLQAIFSNKKGGKANNLREKVKQKRNGILCSQEENQIENDQYYSAPIKPKQNIFKRFENLLKPISNFLMGGNRYSYKRPKFYKCPPEKENNSPKFGFRTLITLQDREHCLPGISCTIDGIGVNKNNFFNDINIPKNNSNSEKREKISFDPSEKFEWSVSGFEFLNRNKRHVQEKISSSQQHCSIDRVESEDACKDKNL